MLAVCALLGAAGNQGAKGAAEDLLTAPHWEIAPEISFLQYDEPGIMKEKGILYGVAGAYTRAHGRGLVRIEGEFALGTMDYEGSLLDGTPYRMDDCHDYLLNLRLLWGRQWEAKGWDSQFHVGLGYRGLNDDSTDDPLGYDRQSAYFYVPLGLKTYHDLAGRWQIGFGGEVDLLLLGLQFSQVYNNGVLTNMQWPGIGARASVELRHRAPSADLAIAPFLQYWWVDDSTAAHGWYEPRNDSLQYGLSLIWRF
jgi:hypothetical protein